MSLLSIILPVYNVENYLPVCLDSIINQTFSDFELIIINDGSTDNSLFVCQDYCKSDTRIKIFTQENSGQSVARNRGIREAQGVYVTFVDSDDSIDRHMYEKMMSEAVRTAADVVMCGHRVVSEDGKILEEIRYKKQNLSGRETSVMVLDDCVMPSFLWDKVYRRSLFEDFQFPEKRIYEDLASTCKVLYKASKVSILDDVFYNYYRRINSTCLRRGKSNDCKRSLDLYLAFKDRYEFACTHSECYEKIGLCSELLVGYGINLIHSYIRFSYDDLIELPYRSLRREILEASKCCRNALSWYRKFELHVLWLMPMIYMPLLKFFYKVINIYKNDSTVDY